MRAFVLVACVLLRQVASVDVTPLQKVVQMLNSASAKGKKEKQEEEVAFAKFQEWCNGVRDDKMRSIADAEAQIKQLNADIQKAESDAEVLAGEIADLEAEIAKWQAEADKATAIRKGEHADYLDAHTDFSESIDALERAISVVKARGADVPQSLLQLQKSNRIPARAKAVIESFLALGSGVQAGAPEANAYEFQSQGVVDLLVKLRRDFEDQRLQLEKEEMNAKHNYNLLNQQLTDDIKYAKETVGKKTATRAGRLEDAANAKGDLAVTENAKAEDEKTLSDTLAECSAAAQEYENNQVVRSEEIKAIAQATEILNSDAVKGNSETYLPAAALLQTQKKGTSLAQLRTADPEIQLRRKLTDFLQARASSLGSRYLSIVAARAASDPFAKVKTMIKDLIVKLSEEANAEADKNAYCTTELATNKQTRENKQAEVDELSAEIDKRTADDSQLASDITTLSDAIAELRAQQSEATNIRNEEKATNTQTIADAKVAQEAVSKATQVLKEFYAQAAGALLQAGTGLRAEMDQAAKAPYKGMQAGSGGIMGMLEVVLSDFARLEAETSMDEEQNASGHQKFMDESNEDIAVKETEADHLDKKKATNGEQLRARKKELELTQTELDKALEYYDTLKQDCLDKGLSYEDRVRAREEEIQSLQEALKILAGENLA